MERDPTRKPHCRKDDQMNLKRFACVVAYDGTNFDGWQTQINGNTVQDKIEARLKKLFGIPVSIAGSGRTDAGVHAKRQTFHFDLPEGPLPRHLKLPDNYTLEQASVLLERALSGLQENDGLSPSIQIRSVRPAASNFHARLSCAGKRYIYTCREGVGSPFCNNYSWILGQNKTLNICAMSAAAKLLVGTHDFSSFGVITSTDPRSPVKNMQSLDVVKLRKVSSYNENEYRDHDYEGDVVTITAVCDRFLYNMMRLISGTLIMVGLGKLTPVDVAMILNARGRTEVCAKQPYKAPARGLCLDYCFYDKIDDVATFISISDKSNNVISKTITIGGNIEIPVLKLNSIESGFGEEETEKDDNENVLKGEVEGSEGIFTPLERKCSIMSNLNSIESQEDNDYGMESGDDDYDDDSVISEEIIPKLGPVFQHFSQKKTVRYDDECSPKSPKLFRPLEQLIEADNQDGDICTALKSLTHMRSKESNTGDLTGRSGDSALFSNSTLSNASSNSIYSNSVSSVNSIWPSRFFDENLIEESLNFSSSNNLTGYLNETKNRGNQSPLSDMNSEKSRDDNDDEEFGSSDEDEDEDDLVIEEGYEELPFLGHMPSQLTSDSTSNKSNNGDNDGKEFPMFSLKLPSNLQTR